MPDSRRVGSRTVSDEPVSRALEQVLIGVVPLGMFADANLRIGDCVEP